MFKIENFKIRAASGAGILLLAGVFAVSSANAADYPELGDFQTGAKVWADNCNRCHNIRGAKELRDDQWITTVFHMRVRAGLTGQEARDVLTFLQGSNTVAPRAQKTSTEVDSEPGTGRSGRDIYGETCVACHGAEGTGSVPGAPNFTRSNGPLGKSDLILVQNIANGFQSHGSPMAMPPKGGNPALNENDIRAVLAYMRKAFEN